MNIIEVTGIDGVKHNADLDTLGKEFARDDQKINVPLLMMDAKPGMGNIEEGWMETLYGNRAAPVAV